MSARSYALDTDAAMQANTGGKRITDAGPYTGKLAAVFYEKNDKGTESINLMFQSDSGQEIGPLAIYTHNGKGDELPGYNAVNALMTCLRVKTMDAKAAPVELYDFDAQRVVTKQKDTYPALMGKPIGLLLRREEYDGRNGVKERMVVAGTYEPSTRLMANEILAKKTEPHDLDRQIAWLEANPLKALKGSVSKPAPASAGSTASDFVDDDIPF